MSATSRELVYQTLNYENPERATRQLWLLPWAEIHHKGALEAIRKDFPDDIGGVPGFHTEAAKTSGHPTQVGEFTDEWGCTFVNIHEGVIGEVKDSLIKDWTTDVEKVHIPREWLSITPDKINQACAESDKFVMAGCCPRPFEQLQFLRGTADLYVDLLMEPPEMLAFMKSMHDFYCELLEKWAQTDVDALMMMDDWGSQTALLIDPEMWKRHFKPMYQDYIQIAQSAGKKMFMHSDGYTLDIYPEMIELGLDAFNTQIFCIGIEKLVPFAGQITFWGEVDRQHLLPEGTTAEIDAAVRKVYQHLWRNGGCIAQCEFGPGGRPENVRQVFASWDAVSTRG